MWVYCITSLAVSQKKKHFRDNGNSLTGEVKHKLMRFVKYLLRISCFLASWLSSLPVFAFSIAWLIKLKESQFFVCLAFLVFFRFFLFSAHLWITESLLWFTRVSCWFNFRNHTPKNCTIAFFDPYNICTQTLWLHALSNTKNWVIHINWMRVEKFWQYSKC